MIDAVGHVYNLISSIFLFSLYFVNLRLEFLKAAVEKYLEPFGVNRKISIGGLLNITLKLVASRIHGSTEKLSLGLHNANLALNFITNGHNEAKVIITMIIFLSFCACLV